MKKFFVVLVLAGALTACNDNAQTTESSTSDSTLAPADSVSAPLDAAGQPADSTTIKVDSPAVK